MRRVCPPGQASRQMSNFVSDPETEFLRQKALEGIRRWQVIDRLRQAAEVMTLRSTVGTSQIAWESLRGAVSR